MTEQTGTKTLENNNPSVFRRYGSQMGIIGVGLFIWFAFIFAAPDVFTDYRIYAAFAQTTPQFGIIALALTFVVITGEMDLSFPSIMALGTAIFCLLVKEWCTNRNFNVFFVNFRKIVNLYYTLGF